MELAEASVCHLCVDRLWAPQPIRSGREKLSTGTFRLSTGMFRLSKGTFRRSKGTFCVFDWVFIQGEGDLAPTASHVPSKPCSHAVTTPAWLSSYAGISSHAGISPACGTHEDLTDRPSCGSPAPEHHALQFLVRQGPNPEQFSLCGSTGNHQVHLNYGKL